MYQGMKLIVNGQKFDRLLDKDGNTTTDLLVATAYAVAHREKYPVMDVIAVAVAVDNTQGLVKAGCGRRATETEQTVYDNRTVALHTLRNMAGRRSNNTDDFPIVLPTDTDREQAQEIFDHFAEIIVMAKLSDSLTNTSRTGRKSDYNLVLSEIFAAKVVDSSKELAMIVSLPNSRRVSDRRALMSEFHAANRTNGYVGELNARVKLSGHVNMFLNMADIANKSPAFILPQS
jgi:hypothetical protein